MCAFAHVHTRVGICLLITEAEEIQESIFQAAPPHYTNHSFTLMSVAKSEEAEQFIQDLNLK